MNLYLFDYFNNFPIGLGKFLGEYYYFYKFKIGGYFESNQNQDANLLSIRESWNTPGIEL